MKKIYPAALLFTTLTCTLSAGAQLISNGGSIVIEDGATITVKGSLSSNANVEGANKIVMQSTARQTLSMHGASLYNLTIDNVENVVLGTAVQVRNNLSFTTGKLITDTNNLTVNGAILGYNSNNYLVTQGGGKLAMSNAGSTPLVFPVGASAYAYQPLTLINSGAADVFSVGVRPNALAYGTTGDSVIPNAVDATWHVEEETTGGSNVTLTLAWNGVEEREKFDRTKAYVSQFENGAWDVAPVGPVAGSDPYSISRSGLTSFSPFTVLSQPGTPLPLRLVSFTAQLADRSVELKWQTTNEINTAYFEVQRSGSDPDFSALGNVAAAGNYTPDHRYGFRDLSPATGINVYRLKMVDKDGKFTYSRAVLVKMDDNLAFQIFPNPASTVLYIQTKAVTNATVQIFDVMGRQVKQQKLTVVGNGFPGFDINDLPKGTYQLTLTGDGKKHIQQFIKQ